MYGITVYTKEETYCRKSLLPQHFKDNARFIKPALSIKHVDVLNLATLIYISDLDEFRVLSFFFSILVTGQVKHSCDLKLLQNFSLEQTCALCNLP